MKKLLSLMLCLFTLAFLAGCGNQTAANTEQAADNSLQAVKDKGKFIVGLDDGFPPMGFKDEKGQIVGFDIDLAKEAAKRLGVKVEFKPVDWDGVVMTLKNGDIDMIWNGMTITEERAKQVAFSKPYISNKQIIVVRSNEQNIKAKADLTGKIIGVQLGSSSEPAVSKSNMGDKIKEVKTYEKNTEALTDLKIGRLDAVVVDEVVGRYYIAEYPADYIVLADDFGREMMGIALRPDDKALAAEIDKILADMKADGTLMKIAEKWFGTTDILAE